MTRPRKMTVDWFPHSATHGKTIFVLEKRYGIRGYAFWFKLLELLASTEGHFIDYNDPATREYVQTYTGGNEDTDEMLKLLESLDAIDRELWHGSRMIWSENFIKGISQVYQNRRVETPPRPDNYNQKLIPDKLSTPILHVENTQKSVEEGEEGEEGEEEKRSKKGIATSVPAVTFFTCPYFVVDLDYRMKLAEIFPAITDQRLLTELSKAEDWLTDNRKKKKWKANGQVANPRQFIRNWLGKIDDIFLGADAPKGFDAVKKFMGKGE